LTHCISGRLRFLARPLEISSEGALVPKSSEAPQFGAILRALAQWVKKAFSEGVFRRRFQKAFSAGQFRIASLTGQARENSTKVAAETGVQVHFTVYL
jgi:hypothetical protein